MKKYALFLLALFIFAVIVGFASRTRNPFAPQATTTPTPRPTAVYEWGEIEIEPFLYAVPLGTFTPSKRLNVVEFPNSAHKVGELPANEPTGFTSEYRNGGDLWLCVLWNVDETIVAWECTGWVLADGTDGSFGTVDRSYEYAPVEIGKEQDA